MKVERPKIVVIEDERSVREMVLDVLEQSGLDGIGAGDGPAGLRLLKEEAADLVLLDIGLPGGLSGLEICRRIRQDPETRQVPIIVLTGQPGDQPELLLLEAGADDYLRKNNFRPDVLVGRIRAVLRRAPDRGAATIQRGAVVIQPARREVLVEGKPIDLTPTEFDILHKLAVHPDRVLTRRDLLDRGDAGEEDEDPIERTVDVHVLSIRRKLGRHADLITTVWGHGYRLGTLGTLPSA
jgi:DNA-binding response OmpR family regulator